MAQQQQQELHLHCLVVGAGRLAKKDLFGLCDPYAKITLRRAGTKSVASYQTKTKKRTLNPSWNELFVFDKVHMYEHTHILVTKLTQYSIQVIVYYQRDCFS
jgi:Ca2+-dependent lipid-binding protein